MTSSQAPTDGQTQTDAVNRTAQEILAALQAKDSAKVASYYAPNAVLATPGRPAAKDSPRTPGHRRPSAQGSGALPLRGHTPTRRRRDRRNPRGSTHANRCGSSSASSASICRGLLLRGTPGFADGNVAGGRISGAASTQLSGPTLRDTRQRLAGVVTATTRNQGPPATAARHRRTPSVYDVFCSGPMSPWRRRHCRHAHFAADFTPLAACSIRAATASGLDT